MMRSTPLPARLLLLLLLLPLAAQAQIRQHGDVGQLDAHQATAQLAHASLSFTENRGQWPSTIRLAAQLRGLDLWITNSSILYDAHAIEEIADDERADLLDPSRKAPPAAVRRRGHLINMEFLGASAGALAHGTARLPGHRNYFIGNDPERWASNVPTYGSARIQELYPGIDAVLYFEEGLPRYDILVAPKADPGAIRIRFNGAERVWITSSGELAMRTSLGTIYQRKLFAYQRKGSARQQVQCSFKRHGDGSIGFSLGSYDTRQPLVIDPLLYSTFFGGSGHDGATALAVQRDTICFTGYAGSSSPVSDSFPATYGAYDITENGANDLFVTKTAPNGALIFSTLIGGALGDEGRDLAFDLNGDMIVCGVTSSADFPTTAGAVDGGYNGGASDGFILKLDRSGSLLRYSTFLGGARGDGAYALAVEFTGNIQLCGYTLSDDFPTTGEAYDRSFNGNIDIFSAIVSADGRSLLSSTYVGGSGDDVPSAIRLEGALRGVIVATTTSHDFPTTPRAFDRSHNGGADIAILRLASENSILDYGSYLGGSGDDHGRDIVMQAVGLVFISGYTSSEDFPATAGAYDPSFNGGAFDAFVTKININTSTIVFSSYLGGTGDDYAQVLALYGQKIWVAGYTASEDFPSTLPAYDRVKNDGHDGFIALLDTPGDSLAYATFFGGEGRDVITDIATAYVGGMRSPARQVLFLCGTTSSFGFPVTGNGHDRELSSMFRDQPMPVSPSYDAFVSKFLPATIILGAETPDSKLRLCPSGTYPIDWISFDVHIMHLDLLDMSGQVYTTNLLTNWGGASGSWDWLLPVNAPTSQHFRLSIADIDIPYLADTGAVDFEIIAGPKLIRGIESDSVCPGEPLSLSAEATGVELRYGWRKNGFTLFGQYASSLRIDSVTAADTGRYELLVFDACGSVSITEIARIDLKPMASIARHPEDAQTCPGGSASFSAEGNGEDLTYQWYKDGRMIPGATSSVYTIDSADQEDGGYYFCEIRNGTCPTAPARTNEARLIVFYETIVTQPRNQIVELGSTLTLNVVVTGLQPTYQWRKDHMPIPGATASSYSIRRVKFSDAGRYDVVITGECTLVSETALVNVTDASAAVTGAQQEDAGGRSLLVQPNPSGDRTTVRVLAGRSAASLRDAELALYDMLGRKVLDLSGELAESGYMSARFDARLIPAGVYYCRLKASGESTGCMVVIEH